MSKAVNEKWKKTFPDTIGNQNRPATGVDDTQPFETGAFPQYMANDPVRYDLQNAAMSQSMSNDARLKEMVDARGKELDDHKVDPGAHKTGIAGNAATATKVVTSAAAGNSANIAEASMAGSDSARIRVSGADNAGELALETADDGNEAIVARQYTGVFKDVARTAAILDTNGNTSFPGTVVAPKFTGALNGNAATASKLLTPRTLSLTGKASGSTTFDGSSNTAINVTSVNADTASKLSTARKINITGNATGAANFDGSSDVSINVTVNESKHAVNADTATHANDVTDAVINYGTSRTGKKVTAMASGVINNLSSLTGSNDLTSMKKLRSYIGSVFNETDWYDVLSIRHRNGADDGINFGLLMYSSLTDTDSIKYKKQPNGNGWTEERTLLDSSNYNSYAPTKTGAGASGDKWNISILGGSQYATKAGTAAACSGNSATASGCNGAFIVNPGGGQSYNEGIRINRANDKWSVCILGGPTGSVMDTDANTWLVGVNPGNNLLFCPGAAREDVGLCLQKDTGNVLWNNRVMLHSGNYNNYAPTKTGSGASGTWPISISGTAAGLSGNLVFPDIGNVGTSNKISWSGSTDGADIYYQTTASDQGNLVLNLRDDDNCYLRIACNGAFKSYFSPSDGNFHGNVNGNADTATNADKLDGYHASDIFRHLGGNQTPVITDIFDRAGTIDMTTMSAADKATHKANINKARNASQNIWNTDTGIAAYGGDYDMANGYRNGSLKLTQSYKNFDKILVVGANDRGDLLIYKLWDVWALANAFAGGSRFQLFHGGDYWFLFGNTRRGTATNYALSTDTVWSCQDQNSGIVAIYGIKY